MAKAYEQNELARNGADRDNGMRRGIDVAAPIYGEQPHGIDAAALRVLEFDKIKGILTNKCVSEIGKQYADELEPSIYHAQINRNLDQTSDAEIFIMRNGSPPLGHIQDIRGVLKRVELGAVLNPSELLQVASVLRSVRGMKRYGRNSSASDARGDAIDARGDASDTRGGASDTRGGAVDARSGAGDTSGGAAVGMQVHDGVSYMINSLVENQRLENTINSCILNEEELADDASPTLQSIRRHIKRIQDSIKDKLSSLLRSPAYQKFMQDSLVTMRHDRYVIPVKHEHRGEIKGLVHDMSSSGATVFIEPMAVVEANNEIREWKAKEVIEIEKILAELTAEVEKMRPELVNDVETLGLLDFLFAKAKLSLDYNCTRPTIGPDVPINIKKGRHPLLSREAVVPIDFWMADGVNTIVVTGPNTGGKTVALKTVGLFTLMAQAGLHVPAESDSSLRLFGKVFADIGDEQSIEQSLSTFSSHMRNIVRIMGEADDATLALFDEIGAGTDPTEGAAIATAILECLYQTGAYSIATTHYSELKLYALLTPGVENACCEFDVNTLRPTYKLLIGLPGKSNAFAISARLGLAPEILARAQEFLTNESVKFEDVLQAISKNKEDAEQERIAAERARLASEGLRNDLLRQRDLLEKQKESILREAREDARRLLLESRREAEEVLDKLRKLNDEDDAALRNKSAQALRHRLKSKLDGVEASLAFVLPPREGHVTPPENLKIGDTVEIVNLNQRGVVQTLPDKNGNALIRAGIMSISAHISNIRLIDEQQSINREATNTMHRGSSNGGSGGASNISSKVMNARAEIDVRGMRLEGAVSQVDRYLDEASLTGLNEVMIIHGKGTGALRSGIQEFLRSHPKAKSYRNGIYGEGDLGVTVVALK